MQAWCVMVLHVRSLVTFKLVCFVDVQFYLYYFQGIDLLVCYGATYVSAIFVIISLVSIYVTVVYIVFLL